MGFVRACETAAPGCRLARRGDFGHNLRLPPRATPCAHVARQAQVVKLVDAGDSKSPAARRAGSIPALGTTTASADISPKVKKYRTFRFKALSSKLPSDNQLCMKVRRISVRALAIAHVLHTVLHTLPFHGAVILRDG
jgi:hypothetical protein